MKAAHWYELAKNQNDPISMYQLALLYEEGDGVEQSNSKAQKLMTDAANQGISFAQSRLAAGISLVVLVCQ